MPVSAYIQQQVAELVRRGIAEARYGNRAAAAALLRRAVQLDPQHEIAWLWLGGVAAEPDEAAFALRAALQLNPHNQNAKRGLRELEAGGQTARAVAVPQPKGLRPYLTGRSRQPDSRWQRWRESRTAARSLGAAVWAIPLVLLAATVGLRLTLTLQTPEIATPAPAPRSVAKSVPAATAVPTPTATAAPQATRLPLPTGTPRSAITAYLATLEQTRRTLREATDSYLASSARRTTAERAAAARLLRDAVGRAREQLEAVVAPIEARDAHQLYLDGLARESEALDDVLAFYAGYDLARSNSAALRMQQARAAIAAAAKQWNALAARYGLSIESSGTQ